MQRGEPRKRIVKALPTGWPSALLLPVAVAFSAVLAFGFDIDWWRVFGLTYVLLMMIEWVWLWFAAPTRPDPERDRSLPDMVVPREAKLAVPVAAGVIGLVLLALWIA